MAPRRHWLAAAVPLALLLAGAATAMKQQHAAADSTTCTTTGTVTDGTAADGSGGAAEAAAAAAWPDRVGSETVAKARPGAPHILLILFDDLGYDDLGGFNRAQSRGGAPLAPVMDGLMDAGIRCARVQHSALVRVAILLDEACHICYVDSVAHADPAGCSTCTSSLCAPRRAPR